MRPIMRNPQGGLYWPHCSEDADPEQHMLETMGDVQPEFKFGFSGM